ncbi:VWA domain-containing protein [Microbacterium sp. GXS0129]|uniref:prealbumin-like fold domain-containing protein n=1 Tax=Microbacterium sp. GXS0129 TaxID=3377836 RepID=UPI00383A40AA
MSVLAAAALITGLLVGAASPDAAGTPTPESATSSPSPSPTPTGTPSDAGTSEGASDAGSGVETQPAVEVDTATLGDAEPGTAEPDPADNGPDAAAPQTETPTDAAPTQAEPTQEGPTEAAPTESPAPSAPSQTSETLAPTDAAPTEPAPAPADTEPVPTKTEPAPTKTEPVPTKTEPAPADTEPVPTKTEPVEQPPATSAPAVSASATPTPTPTQTPPTRSARTLTAMAALADCGSSASACGRLTATVTVGAGGPLTASDFALTATSSAGTYDLTSGVTANVARPASYVLASTPSDTAQAALYDLTVSCTVGNLVTWNAATQTLTYSGQSTTNDGRRSAACTFAYAYSTGTITVKVGGDRTGSNGVTDLAGVVLRLYSGGSSGPGSAFAAGWATCTSQADGSCTFTVPATGTAMGTGGSSAQTGGNKDRQFWIVAESAPSGWVLNQTLATGSSGQSSLAYTFRTPAITSGATLSSTSTSQAWMISSDNSAPAASGGIWSVSRANAPLGSACGVDVAVLVDLSGSLAGQLANVKSAAKSVVDALQGTDSKVGVYTFAQSAPSSSGGNLAATQVATTAGADAVRSHIDSFTTPSGGTNWDAGLAQIPTGTYEAVIVVTDGNPTYFGSPATGPGNFTRFRETENGVFSANRLKAAGTRVIALGVGDGVGGPADNLRAISGPSAGSDYFQTADFTAAKSVIRQFALGDCLGSLSVVKQVAPSTTTGEDTTGAAPAGGWDFTATSQTAGVSVTSPTQTTAADTGVATFPLTYSGTSSGTIRVTEAQQSGYAVVTQSGFTAVCTAKQLDGSSVNLPVTNIVDAAHPGFAVDVPQQAAVSCTVFNRAPVTDTSVTVDKHWVINGGAEVANDQLPLAGVSASLQLDGTDQAWGSARDGVTPGNAIAIAETVTIPPNLDQCTSSGVIVRDAAGATVATALPFSPVLVADASKNAYTVVNTLTCGASLTLVKQVEGGTADPSGWTLAATGPQGSIAFEPGTSGVTHPVTPDTVYTLSESGGSALYVLATWSCVAVDANGAPLGQPQNTTQATVALGTRLACTAVNRGASLSVGKTVTNDDGGTAVAADFSLTATPEPLAGLTATTVTGAETPATANTFPVRPGHVYTLTESSMPGYQNTGLQRLVDGDWVDVADSGQPGVYPRVNGDGEWEVVVDALGSDAYRFVNDDEAASLTLIKQVVNDDGGTAAASDWTLTATGSGAPAISLASGAASPARAGVPYVLAENGPSGYALTALSCDNGHAVSVDSRTLTLALGEHVTCTFTNDDIAPTLTLRKDVINDNGGTRQPGDWSGLLSATADGETVTYLHNQTRSVAAGDYALSEQQLSGYAQTDLSCVGSAAPLDDAVITLQPGQNVTCTFTNDDIAPKLTLMKTVDNRHGGTADASAWELSATAADLPVLSGTSGVSGEVTANVPYTLEEQGDAPGYELSDISCTNGDGSPADPTVTLLPGDDVTCAFTNADQPARLRLVKSVITDDGGDAVAADWDQLLTAANGPDTTAFDSGETIEVGPGVFELSEGAGPAGYALTALSCDGQNTSLANPTVSVGLGGLVTCTFTNDDVAPTLTLVKEVVNANGGTATAGEWSLSAAADGTVAVGGTTPASGTVRANTEYTLSESGGPSGYTLTGLACTGAHETSIDETTITLGTGENVTCTFTNTDAPGSLTLVKSVVNDDGGSAVPSDWNQLLTARSGDAAAVLFDSGETQSVPAGSYGLAELAGPAGYTLTGLSCDTGDVSPQNPTVMIGVGQHVVCTFTNDDVAPRLTLVKTMEHRNGGTATADDWTLEARTPGGPNVLVIGSGTRDAKAGATYTLSESGPGGYSLEDLSCTGERSVSADDPQLVLAIGEDVTCTFRNVDQPASLTLVKKLTANAGGTAVPADWNQRLVASTGSDDFAFDSGETRAVPAGEYTLSELAGPVGYALTDLSCTTREVSVDAPHLVLHEGESATCTFTNTAQPVTLTLVKSVDNAAGGTRSADEWTLSASTDAGFAINGTGALGEDGEASISGSVQSGVAYRLHESGPSDYDSGTWQCRAGDGEIAVTDGSVTLPDGTDVTCRIVNTAIPADGAVTKTVLSNTQNADGTWSVVYEVRVANTGRIAYTYDLVDTLDFGDGITVDEATWSGAGRSGAFGDDHSAQLASDASVAAGTTEVYTVTAIATVTPAAVNDATIACYGGGEGDSGGFLNTVVLTSDRLGEHEAEACAEPIIPTIQKSAISSARAGDGTWTISYRVDVASPTPIPAGTSVHYSVTDMPELPASLALVGDWSAVAEPGSPAPSAPEWDGTGSWTLISDGVLTTASAAHSWIISATVKRTDAPVVVEPCDDGSGAVVWNGATLTSGAVTEESRACAVVEVIDVSLTKTAQLAEGETSVEPGDAFSYVLTVTNNGTRTANDVSVTDTDIPERVRIDAVQVVGDGVTWGPEPGFDESGVNLVLSGLAPGASAQIIIHVTFVAAAGQAVLPPGSTPEAPAPVEKLDNTACVSIAGDEVASNNCDTATVPIRDIAAVVFTTCDGDAPMLGWTIRKSSTLTDEPIEFRWTPDTGTSTTRPPDVVLTAPGGTSEWSDLIAWPGAEFTPSGVSIDYPGWRMLRASDYTPDGRGYYIPGTTTVMTPEQVASHVYNGLILDDSELDYAWRGETTITFSVNPTLTFTTGYPPATPSCAVPRHTKLAIDKIADRSMTTGGGAVDWSIAIRNVSDDSAAEGVVLTDEIPDTLKVTGVTWQGKGDTSVFPNWKDCTVSGASARGYGGTLTCTLFGPLQPQGDEGVSQAPTVKISTVVDPQVKFSRISNTAVVDYHTFGDPSDAGRASSEANVGVTLLAVTGSQGLGTALLVAIAIMGLGVLLVLRHRRRSTGRS